jgi:uncharacterized membrane protein HdeD (DUF308 family)
VGISPGIFTFGRKPMNRVTGIGTSLVLLAAGAILAFAVDVDAEGFNLNTIGWILMGVGLLGLVLSLLLASSPVRDRTVVTDTGVDSVAPTRERVIERERY